MRSVQATEVYHDLHFTLTLRFNLQSDHARPMADTAFKYKCLLFGGCRHQLVLSLTTTFRVCPTFRSDQSHTMHCTADIWIEVANGADSEPA